jgi:hypothetical protein
VCHLGVDLLSVSYQDPSCGAESKSVTYLKLNIAFFREILPRVDWLDEYCGIGSRTRSRSVRLWKGRQLK